jgi:hypothetical protein
MAVYADYAFYTQEYKGTAISFADFDHLMLQASAVIDQVTANRAAAVITADTDTDKIAKIKLATCAVADELQHQEQGGKIQSERVGQHSVTYAAASAISDEVKMQRAAKRYLVFTDLMYRGILDEDTA